MNISVLEPSLALLLFKVVYFLFVIYWVGWAIYCLPVFVQSRVSTWVFRQSIGAGVLLIVGFNLVSFDIPANWLLLMPPLLIGGRLLLNRFTMPIKIFYSDDCDSIKKSFYTYLIASVVIAAIYLMPFILTLTSGLYAYGGGDHSSYFRISDLVMNKSLKQLMLSWGLTWPPISGSAGYSLTSEMMPPLENWSINQFAFYIKYARLSWTFANQTIAVPFLALGLNNPEESYTAAVTVYLILMCWSAAIFAASIAKCISRSQFLALAACAVVLGGPAMSLALKQTVPAIYAWSSMLLFTSALIYRRTQNQTSLTMPIPFGIAIASTYLMYLPAFFVSGPLWLYLFFKNITTQWRGRLVWGILVILMLVMLTNIEIDRPMLLLMSNASGAILDYGLKLKFLPITFFGVADFETLISNQINLWPAYSAAAAILAGLFLFKRELSGEKVIATIFLAPIVCAIAYFWYKSGHYHVIRMIEFIGVVIVAMSTIGILQLFRFGRNGKWIAGVLIAIFLINAFIIKLKIVGMVVSSTPQARSGMVTANDIRLSEVLTKEFEGQESPPLVYWMGWGSVPFANHEIVFRKLRFVEAFEYDYAYSKFNLLDLQNLDDAVLIYPSEKLVDILQINPDALDDNKIIIEGRPVQRVGRQSGAAILGTGWLPPTIEAGQPVRYLRSSQEGGLVIWSSEPKKVMIQLEASGFEAGMSLTLMRMAPENSQFFAGNEEVLRRKSETSKQYFARMNNSVSMDPGSVALLNLVEAEMRNSSELAASAFNAVLSKNKFFNSFLIHNLENKGELVKNFDSKYKSQQLTYSLNSYQDSKPTKIKLNFELQKGVNVLQFIARDSQGRRSGRDPLTTIAFNPEVKTQYLVIRKIQIGIEGQGFDELR